MKKKILLVATVLALLLILVACAGGFDSIMFEKQPRTVYVQGQDIDFTDTILVAMKGDKKEDVDLTSDDVVITGYDKNQLGKQTVTFTYKDASTSIIVNVIPRMTFEGVVTDYFVGDDINRAEGRIRVADDQGKTTTVNFNSELITTEGFNSKAAGDTTVTVKYGGYSATYTAKVYEVEDVELSKKPKKTLYDSHDTEFDTTGAYFTVTANGGALSRYVNLTADMIKDFDPSLATSANVTDRLSQTVTIEYLGFSEKYEIFIAYSGVSYMNDVAKLVEDVNDPKSCNAEYAEEALRAITAYFELIDSEKELIDERDTEKIALIAAYHGYEQFKELTDKYSESFVLVKTENRTASEDDEDKYYGVFNIRAESYEAAQIAIEALQSEEGETIEALADTLRSIEEEFHDLKIDGENMDEYLGTVFFEDGIETIIGLFGIMVEIYEDLSVVPVEWTADELAEHKANIKKAVVTITNSEFNPYKSMSYLEIFKMLSQWREKNDVFDIISAYYLTHEPDSYSSAIWEKIPLPGELNNLYLAIAYGLSATNNMSIGTDTTPFMYYYKLARDISERIKNGDNQLEKDVYDKLSFDYLMRVYFYTGENVENLAYVYHAAGFVGNERVEALFEKYIALVTRVYNEEDFDFTADDVVSESKSLLKDFLALSPSERYGVCSIIHCDYRNNILEESIFDYVLTEEGEMSTYNLFSRLILNAYKSTLSSEGYELFTKMFVASEYASLYIVKVGGDEEFIAAMEEINASIDNIPLEEKTTLKALFADVFVIYEELKTPSTPSITGYEDKFEELNTLINRFFELNYTIGNTMEADRVPGMYALLYANYEKAKKLADEIALIEDENVRYNFYYIKHTFNTDFEDDGEDKNFSCSYDFILEQMGTVHAHTLLYSDVSVQHKEAEEGEIEDDYITQLNAYYVYDASKIADFLAEAYDVMYAQYMGTASELDIEYVLSLMKKRLDFNADQLFALKTLNIGMFYYGGVLAAFSDSLDTDMYAFLEKLLAADEAHAIYITEDLTANLEAFTEAIDALKTAYEPYKDNAEFEFKEFYDYLVSAYEEAIAPDEEAPEDETPDEDNTSGDVTP